MNEKKHLHVCLPVTDMRLAASVPARLRGLGGSRKEARSLTLVPCRSIHTVGMPYALDVAFVDRAGGVVEVQRAVKPGSRLSCRRAVAVIERHHDPQLPWFQPQEQVVLAVRRKNSSGYPSI